MTIAELIGHWGERDNRYATRRFGGQKQPLTDNEILSIRAYRLSEVRDLPENDQRLGRTTVERWIAPTSMNR